MLSERTRTVIITVVTAVWAANFIAGVLLPSYEVSEQINGIFMTTVAATFAIGARQSEKERGGNGKHKK